MIERRLFDKNSLLLYTGIYVGSGLLINLLTFVLGWQNAMNPPSKTILEIPSAIQAVGWTLDLFFLAIATWWLRYTTKDTVYTQQRWVFVFFVTTIAWPLVSLSTGIMYLSVISSFVSFAAGIYALWISFRVSRVYVLLLGVPLLWMFVQSLNFLSGWRVEVGREFLLPFMG